MSKNIDFFLSILRIKITQIINKCQLINLILMKVGCDQVCQFLHQQLRILKIRIKEKNIRIQKIGRVKY